MAQVTCGIDWAENHHDVALVDQNGNRVARLRIGDDAAGHIRLLELLAEHGDSAQAPIPVAIETPRGLLVAALRATGRPIYPINPWAVSRYRDRHSVARKKSDAGDALVLANILRTDLLAHRQLPADSDLARAIRVLARAQQDAVWDRTALILRLRSLLREYYPGMLTALAHTKDTLASPVGRTLLSAAPDPTSATELTESDIAALLVKAGRSRGITAAAQHFHQALHSPQMRQPPLVEHAFAQQALALLRQLDTVIANVQALTDAATEAFAQHPDAGIINSFPGLSPMQGARILGELGDDRTRFTDARALKAYAGSAPVTRASGKNRAVFTRRVKNQRLASAGYQWAFNTLAASPGAKAHYQRRREHGDWHNAALRHLFNRQLGILHHCLTTRQTYNETKAFPEPQHDHSQPPTQGAPPPAPPTLQGAST